MKTNFLAHISCKTIVPLSLLSVLVLSGCSAAEAKANTLRFFRIISDEECQSYIDLANNGQLDADGSYIAGELNDASEFLPPEGSVHVTFAQNDYIHVQYYVDSDLKKPIDTKQCYLMPGDRIYASEPVCDHPSSKWYKFDRFCVYAHDGDGKRAQELSWNDAEGSALVLRVPEEPVGTEISVTPMGIYEDRILELTDHCIDSMGRQQELSGTWIVNGQETASAKIEVSPVDPLEVDFHYNAEEYDFVSSEPGSFYHEKGLVRFETAFADSAIEKYSVELRSLEGMFQFDPSEYTVEHGTVIFESSSGIRIAEPCYIPDGQTITYTAIPDDGYHHPTGTGQVSVNAADPLAMSDVIRQAIRFYPDEEITVSLPQPPAGGSIEYTANGDVLSEKTCELRCGTVISMKYNRWNGWIINADAREEYIVTDQSSNQAADIGIDINTLFTESEAHKPVLKVILKDSMEAAKFAVSSSAGQVPPFAYNDPQMKKGNFEWLGQNDRYMEINKIGTGGPIMLKVTEDTIVNGQAMKLDITAKDDKGVEHKFTPRYITYLPIEEPIVLYNDNQLFTSTISYQDITITVGKVDVSTYRAKTAAHASISLKLVDGDSPRALQDGEVLESSSNVEVSIVPDQGYSIAGAQSSTGVYKETMAYSKWEKEYQKILDKHPAREIWFVTLDTSDDFGTCVYKLDGKVVSGIVSVREGQKLILEYTLTDPGYQITREGIGSFVSNVFSNKKESCSISIDASLDGRTVKRSDYITIEKKEG